MRKFAFLAVLVFSALSVFAQTAADYAKILRKDLSAFAGYWVNGGNERIYLRADGTIFFKGSAGNFKKSPDGYYTWSVAPHEGPGGGVMLFPAGMEIPRFYGSAIATDTAKVRLAMGQEPPGGSAAIYYRESQFPPATHVTTENLKVRTWQSLGAETVTVLKKGTRVLVQDWGDELTLDDGSSARWAHVFTSDGFEGWCYSGYMEEL